MTEQDRGFSTVSLDWKKFHQSISTLSLLNCLISHVEDEISLSQAEKEGLHVILNSCVDAIHESHEFIKESEVILEAVMHEGYVRHNSLGEALILRRKKMYGTEEFYPVGRRKPQKTSNPKVNTAL